MKIQHVLLPAYAHVLVIDGLRGPLANYGAVATHPAGVIAYHPTTYGTSQALKGKVFVTPGADVEVEVIEDLECHEAAAAYSQFCEISTACTNVKLARYGEEAKP